MAQLPTAKPSRTPD